MAVSSAVRISFSASMIWGFPRNEASSTASRDADLVGSRETSLCAVAGLGLRSGVIVVDGARGRSQLGCNQLGDDLGAPTTSRGCAASRAHFANGGGTVANGAADLSVGGATAVADDHEGLQRGPKAF